MLQQTVKKDITLQGVGLHFGTNTTITIKAANCNHGYKFKRIDLEGMPIIAADANKVVSTNRSTTIQSGTAQVSTIEHLLSALVGCGVDNALIEIDGPEVPILDGSARLFVEAIQQAGILTQDQKRDYLIIDEPITYQNPETGSEITLLPHDDYELDVFIDFNSPVLAPQYATFGKQLDYTKDIAPCRTFVFVHELEYLLSQDLIKGGDLDNAIVIANEDLDEQQCAELASKLGKNQIKINKGILNTVELAFDNELARHKLLDLMGDLALIGVPIKGRIIAKKPGHASNVAFSKLLKKHYQQQKKLKGMPKYDPRVSPLFNTMQIAAMLPHRYPFLLVDKIIELSESHVVGIKNVTFNEHFFQGHFPNNPVFPGVLQIEAMAQTGGILALSTVPDPENWDTYFLKIDNAKFKYKVTPGDTIIFKLILKAPIRRGIVQMDAIAYVGNNIVSEADLTAQIVRRTTT